MLEAIQIPPSWENIDADLSTGTVLLIGAIDSGKSTLARWLTVRLARAGRRTGWLDGDVGQATMGVPATMSLSMAEGDEAPASCRTFFVGATSPRGHMLPVLVGLHRLKEWGVASGAETVIVDTTGLVAPESGGGALKEWKIELLQPRTVIALQQERELEHLLAPLRRDRRVVLRVLEPAASVRRRSPEERAARRSRLFRDYFSSSFPVRIPMGRFPVYGLEKALPGQLLSLNDEEGFSVSLGIVLKRSGGELEVLSPPSNLRRVAAVRVGSLRLDPATGEEMTL